MLTFSQPKYMCLKESLITRDYKKMFGYYPFLLLSQEHKVYDIFFGITTLLFSNYFR